MSSWRGRFVLPQLDKETYKALQALRESLKAEQKEIVELGIKLAALAHKGTLTPITKQDLLQMLQDLRATAPSDQPQIDIAPR